MIMRVLKIVCVLADTSCMLLIGSGDEVEEMLKSLSGAVNADVGSEMINSHHTSALLLRQLFQQADKWYLQMTADISAMENR